MNVTRFSYRVMAAVFAVAVSAPSVVAGQAPAALNIMETAKASFATFARLATEAGLAPMLRGTAEFTVFAPTDEAFARMPKETLAALEADTAALKRLLLYHVVSGKIGANKVLNLKNARTMSGSKVEFSVRDARLRVNDVVIVRPDVKVANGVVHGIDGVLALPKP